MIVALAFSDCGASDTPDVWVVDTEKCTKVWRTAIESEVTWKPGQPHGWAMPEDWNQLRRARVKLPALVEHAVHVYYGTG